MCCATPFFKCIQKNVRGETGGKTLQAYAQCRNGSKQDPCPCQNPPCVDYKNDWQMKVKKVPWTCVELTGGCSAAYKQCGPGKGMDAKDYHGKPCCQWGCTCDYSVKWAAQCKPPNGSYACTKDAEKAAGTGAANRFAVIHDGAPYVRAAQGSPLPWLASIAGAAVLASSGAMLLRKRRGPRPADTGVEADQPQME